MVMEEDDGGEWMTTKMGEQWLEVSIGRAGASCGFVEAHSKTDKAF